MRAKGVERKVRTEFGLGKGGLWSLFGHLLASGQFPPGCNPIPLATAHSFLLCNPPLSPQDRVLMPLNPAVTAVLSLVQITKGNSLDVKDLN